MNNFPLIQINVTWLNDEHRAETFSSYGTLAVVSPSHSYSLQLQLALNDTRTVITQTAELLAAGNGV